MVFQSMEERIIDFIRSNKFLYDRQHRLYKNQLLRDKKFKELADELDVPVKKLKLRWRTLRDKYMRERKLSKQPTELGGAPVQHKWKWSQSLSFLDGTSSENHNSSENFDADNMEAEMNEAEHDESIIVEEITPHDVEVYHAANIERYRNRAKRLRRECNSAHHARPNQKSSTRLYFEMLTQQVEELNLTTIEFSALQVDLLLAMQNFITNKRDLNAET